MDREHRLSRASIVQASIDGLVNLATRVRPHTTTPNESCQIFLNTYSSHLIRFIAYDTLQDLSRYLHARSASPQLTTFPTFHRRLLPPEGIPNSRASRLSCRQRSHRLTFLSSGGGGGPNMVFTADAEAGPEDNGFGVLSFRAYPSWSVFE